VCPVPEPAQLDGVGLTSATVGVTEHAEDRVGFCSRLPRFR
jgi:hypothetical protein